MLSGWSNLSLNRVGTRTLTDTPPLVSFLTSDKLFFGIIKEYLSSSITSILCSWFIRSSDIPKYAIAGGHPAKPFAYRDKEHFEKLKKDGLFLF